MKKKIDYSDKHSVSYKVEDFKPFNYGEEKPTFVKLNRTKETEEMMKDPNCFLLLCQIAMRSRRLNCFNPLNLEQGEALIGDYKNIGLTQQKYRTAKMKLEKWGFITTKSTNEGTIAKLINITVCDPNFENINERTNERVTNEQRTGNERATTNKKDKKDNKEKNIYMRLEIFRDSLTPFVETYGEEMIRAFYDYWREFNKSKTKMRWETQTTWDLNLRLKTWERNQDRWHK